MRIEHKRELEQARRRGLAWRTILGVIWLVFCFVVAYFASEWLVENGYISYNRIYNTLFIPRTVDQWVLQLGIMVLIVIFMQFFILIGYGLFSFVGRRRPGEASLYSDDPDPGEDIFRYD